MDDAVRARSAAREACSDIAPARLREVLDDRLADASMTPGVLTFLSARAVTPEVEIENLAGRAAGVQLIYEGLRLTRALSQAEPWDDDPAEVDADLDILAADVLVSRGFYLLARSDAAERAVETVRAFGRDQTLRGQPGADGAGLDRNLEADVFELAVIAGTTAVDAEAPAELLAYAEDLAREYEGDLPPAPDALPEPTRDRIASLSTDPVRSSAPDR